MAAPPIEKLICQVYLRLDVSRRCRTKQPLRMEDNADKEDQNRWRMRNKAFLLAAVIHFIELKKRSTPEALARSRLISLTSRM